MLIKKVIAFRTIPFPHTGRHIHEVILGVLNEYSVVPKFFSLSFDNASANVSAIDYFQRSFVHPYPEYSKLFHVRCACHIIHLVVYDAIKVINETDNLDFIRKIRNAVLYITRSPTRLQYFKKSCTTFALKPRSFVLDTETRWNSTYMMLKSVEGYETVILDVLNDSDFELDMIDFENCKVFTNFLGVFYTATKKLSGVYYPTTCIVLNQLYNIAAAFKECRDSRLYGRVVKLMEEKYLRYWEEMPPLFLLGSIMDPWKKIVGTVALLEGIAELFGIPCLDNFFYVNEMLLKLFNHYRSTYGSNVQTTVVAQSNFAEQDPSERLLSTTSSTTDLGGTSNTSFISELVRYLELDISVFFGNSALGRQFDIMQFWSTHGSSFPVLQIMARDLLTPPVSTVASESCFSMSGRILSKKRSRPAPDTLEALVCSKDCNAARKRRQEFKDSYVEVFSNLDS
ncbi:hypothetical protein MKW94_018081 [Papaver nudicaule]|uniref:HAT C-terminal dimerisation domain-containing protein n=1 Tax=Papaver nudicaule TaxID=74823 RepID=A0AA41W3E6_PAPNU|nr:hypothetical protein [Papaver nudicaule]